jgi:nitrite reductase/ring-hydroxylating ferredoxin subunit
VYIRGVYVFNTGSGYNAFEAACPNQALSACSTMTLKGIKFCSCDNNEYSLFTGLSQGGSQYPLKQYRVEVNGTILRVYN